MKASMPLKEAHPTTEVKAEEAAGAVDTTTINVVETTKTMSQQECALIVERKTTTLTSATRRKDTTVKTVNELSSLKEGKFTTVKWQRLIIMILNISRLYTQRQYNIPEIQ